MRSGVLDVLHAHRGSKHARCTTQGGKMSGCVAHPASRSTLPRGARTRGAICASCAFKMHATRRLHCVPPTQTQTISHRPHLAYEMYMQGPA